METEAKAKVITSVWGAKLIQFLASLAILQRWTRIPVGFRVPHAHVPRFFLRVPRSRVSVRHVFRVPLLFCVPTFPMLLQFTHKIASS